MCGIYARICRFQNCNEDHSTSDENASSEIKPRGKDSFTFTNLNSQIGLGFSRLAIRNLEKGVQPYVDIAENSISIINGELFNDQELVEKFDISSDISNSGDMAVLSALISRNGPDVLSQCYGQFAGILINYSKNKVLLFRDAVGEKPLFFSKTESHIYVSSNIKSFKFIKVINKVNGRSKILSRGYFIGDDQLFENVTELSPGHHFQIELQENLGSKPQQYWDWPKRSKVQMTQTRQHDFIEIFEKLAKKVVIQQLRSDVPSTILLSGGLDSLLLGSLINEVNTKKLDSFTLGFQNETFDESGAAIRNSIAIGAKSNIIMKSFKEIGSSIPAILASMETPILDPAYLSLYTVCKELGKDYKVAFSGDGGDELFQGYKLYTFQQMINFLIRGRVLTLPILETFLKIGPSKNNSYLNRQLLAERMTDVLKFQTLDRLETCLSPFSGSGILDEAVKKKPINAAKNGLLSRSRIEEFYSHNILPNVYLKKSDSAGLVNSVEIRSPFLDRRLIELAYTFPESLIKKNPSKLIFREILTRRHPDLSLEKKKHGFTPPLVEILQYVKEPKWHLECFGLTQVKLSQVWRSALNGNQNSATAAWGVLVLNNFLKI